MDLPGSARVVIIGGGFAGTATAYFLAARGVSELLLIEREQTLAAHASGRNAAICLQLTEDDRVSELAMRGAEFLRTSPTGFSSTPLLDQTGSVLLAESAEQVASWTRAAAGRGLAVEAITGADASERWPQLGRLPAACGLWVPSDGVIDIHALLTGYVEGARAGGASIITGCAVTAIHDDGDGARVVTTSGVVRADMVVNAAGAWAGLVGSMADSTRVDYRAFKRHLVSTGIVTGAERRAPSVWFFGSDEFYVRPDGAGYLLSGCDWISEAPGDARPNTDAVERLAEKLVRVAPDLAGLPVARVWACLRTFSPTRRPVIGTDPDRPWLFWVAGLGGHGATGSAAIGQDAARAIAEALSA